MSGEQGFLVTQLLAETVAAGDSPELDRLQRGVLEDLAQQLFIVLKQSEGELAALRQEAAAVAAANPKLSRAKGAGAVGRDGRSNLANGRRTTGRSPAAPMGRQNAASRSGPNGYRDGDLPDVFKRLTTAQSQADMPTVDIVPGAHVVSEEQAAQIVDRLYHAGREKRFRRQVYAEMDPRLYAEAQRSARR
eukprot:gnl/TRDRNA2_/TRDRNA2_182920_c0_seq1.p1 gnl/TRDRNA2_/TRDRNA2_182920_c0~~gnl/TRDRNA2_/TRDRNA2_182920_c0_seq1.p1  ORF type:complete len:191 (-),score=42.98 gnl/TRDRNA2_/TRDRNA2_182920_c0_seq1:44-616(-)